MEACRLENLAAELRVHGLGATVEYDASRVALAGHGYVRPDAKGTGLVAWHDGGRTLWYGRFPSVSVLVTSLQRARRLRQVARVSLALAGALGLAALLGWTVWGPQILSVALVVAVLGRLGVRWVAWRSRRLRRDGGGLLVVGDGDGVVGDGDGRR